MNNILLEFAKLEESQLNYTELGQKKLDLIARHLLVIESQLKWLVDKEVEHTYGK